MIRTVAVRRWESLCAAVRFLQGAGALFLLVLCEIDADVPHKAVPMFFATVCCLLVLARSVVWSKMVQAQRETGWRYWRMHGQVHWAVSWYSGAWIGGFMALLFSATAEWGPLVSTMCVWTILEGWSLTVALWAERRALSVVE